MQTTKVTVVVPFEIPGMGNQRDAYASKLGTARNFALTQAFAAVPGSVDGDRKRDGDETVANVPARRNGAYLLLAFEATFTFRIFNPSV